MNLAPSNLVLSTSYLLNLTTEPFCSALLRAASIFFNRSALMSRYKYKWPGVFQNLNMSKSKQTEKKGEKGENAGGKVEAPQGPQSVAEVFSLSRDIEVLHPYHLDGDV